MSSSTKLTHSITLYQGGVELSFRLNEKEYQHAKRIADLGNNHNFEWFTWSRHHLSPSKSKRFGNNFNYHKGDFCVVELF